MSAAPHAVLPQLVILAAKLVDERLDALEAQLAQMQATLDEIGQGGGRDA